MTTQELYEDNWLVAYEANAQGWLPSAEPKDHVDEDGAFGYLKRSGVKFYSSANNKKRVEIGAAVTYE